MQFRRTLPQSVWPALRSVLIRSGFAGRLLRSGLLGLTETRRYLSLRYLPSGTLGLEIGALHCPLPLHLDSKALYIDRDLPDVLRKLRADAGDEIVQPDIITDGFRLRCIAPDSQDFIIANHVLEHTTDALGTLKNWLGVLRPGGLIFVAVPRGERCFDRGRAITSADHFLEDFRLCAIGAHEQMRERNLVHVEEHLAISAPALAKIDGVAWVPLEGVEHQRQIDRLLGQDSAQIHHHVFTRDSFFSLLGLLGEQVRIECVANSSVETVGIVRKVA
jgi:SAM-dependent methyltransferase